jgi:hypothetical protein
MWGRPARWAHDEVVAVRDSIWTVPGDELDLGSSVAQWLRLGLVADECPHLDAGCTQQRNQHRANLARRSDGETALVVGMQHLHRALLGSVSARSDRPEACFDSNFVASIAILSADK